MDDADPLQFSIQLLDVLEFSPWVVLALQFTILVVLLFLSAWLQGIEAALDSMHAEKKEKSAQLNPLAASFNEVKSGLSILQFLFRSLSGLVLAHMAVFQFGIEDANSILTLSFGFILLMNIFGTWNAFLIPVNKDYQQSSLVVNGLLFIAFIFSPIIKLATGLKKNSKSILKNRGYVLKEKKNEKATTSFAKTAESFNLTNVRQVMRNRVDITAFDIELDMKELLENINLFGFSRIPVYRETIDKIEGILYIKDLMPYANRANDFPWQNLLRPAYFIPETKKINELLKEFQEKHQHMALVVDDYGGISGLVTLEDVLEEIVGEINDELDEVDLNYIKLDNSAYIFEGKTSLNDFCRVLGIENSIFEDVKGESESLGGLLLEINSNLPKKGDKIYFKNFVFRIDSANNKRIKKVRVELLEEEGAGKLLRSED